MQRQQRPQKLRRCVVGGVGFACALAYEAALQLRLSCGIDVHTLALGEDRLVRLAWDLAHQPWFQCHNLVAAWRPDVDMRHFSQVRHRDGWCRLVPVG